MRLEVSVANDAALRLYESAGYSFVELLNDYYEDGSAAIRFEKALALA